MMNRVVSLLVLTVCWGSLVLAQLQPTDVRVPATLRGASLAPVEATVITRGDSAYVPTHEIFNLIGIYSRYDTTAKILYGFFMNEDQEYRIEFTTGVARYQNWETLLTSDDFILLNDTIYFKVGFLNSLFQLDIIYNPRRLEVFVKNGSDLPSAIAARRVKLLQRRMRRKDLPEPDLKMERVYDYFSGGRVNWTSVGRFSKSSYVDSRANVNFGMKVIGGDFTGRVLVNSRPGRTDYAFRGNLRYAFLESSWIRQVILGDFVSFGILPREVTGVEFTNRPASIRRLFTREVFQGEVEPNMDIAVSGSIGESFLNRADDLGSFEFDVPVLYGNGLIEVKAFDQWGQERLLRYRMLVPRSLLPPGEVEYSLSAGKIRQQREVASSASSVLWGLTKDVSLGARAAYYDASNAKKFYLGLSGVSRLSRNLIFEGFVSPDALASLALSLELPSSARFSITQSRYGSNKFFNPSGIDRQHEASVRIPFSIRQSGFILNFLGSTTEFVGYRNDEIQGSITAVFKHVTPSISSQLISQRFEGSDRTTQLHLTNLSLFSQLPAGLNIGGGISYDNLSSSVTRLTAYAMKRASEDFLVSLTYLRLLAPINFYTVGLRLTYYFPFARASAGIGTSGDNLYEYTATAGGSLYFDLPNKAFFLFNRNSSIGTGAFDVRPFLDANANGLKDEEEEAIDHGQVYYTNLNFGERSFGKTIVSTRKSLLSGYELYNLNLDPASLDNPAWVPLHAGVQVFSEPNFIRRIDMPVVAGGIIRGGVKIAATTLIPAEGITIYLTSTNGIGIGNSNAGGKSKPGQQGDANKNGDPPRFSKTVTTFSTGEFEFLAVPPGTYELSLDAEQLARLGYTAKPLRRSLTVAQKPEGDVLSGLDFTLTGR